MLGNTMLESCKMVVDLVSPAARRECFYYSQFMKKYFEVCCYSNTNEGGTPGRAAAAL